MNVTFQIVFAPAVYLWDFRFEYQLHSDCFFVINFIINIFLYFSFNKCSEGSERSFHPKSQAHSRF